MDVRPSDLLFVYGTLMPGHLRWPMLAGRATAWGEVSVPGQLWDTGAGWPAARFGDARTDPGRAELVPGWWVRLRPVDLARALPSLDEMEGIGDPPDPAVDPYARVAVEVTDVGVAWAYHATRVEPGWRRIDRWEGFAEA